MKKTAVIAAVLLLAASQARAYENAHAGYSIRDRNPFCKMESSRLYAFSAFGADTFSELNELKTGNVHAVNYYTAEEMAQILGEPFSTAYFDRQYEQLALLQRSELDLRTVPVPLLDLQKYAVLQNKNTVLLQQYLLQEQFGRLEPGLRIDKPGAHRAITLTHAYRQGQRLIFLHTSFLSANDRLYQLTTISFSEQPAAEGKRAEVDAPKREDASAAGRPDADAWQQALKIEPVQKKDLDAALAERQWQAHKKFVKGFKSIKPVNQRKPLSYRDFAAPGEILLPEDWFYAQMQFREKEASGSFTCAASLPVMQKIAREFDYSGLQPLLGLLATGEATPANKESANAAEKTPAAADGFCANNAAEAHKALSSLDALLMTCSIKVKDNDLREMLSTPVSNKRETEASLNRFLQGMQRSGNDLFALKHYDYRLDFAVDKANIDINTDILLLKEHALKNLLRCTAYKDKCALLLFVHKPDYAAGQQLQQSIEEWQF